MALDKLSSLTTHPYGLHLKESDWGESTCGFTQRAWLSMSCHMHPADRPLTGLWTRNSRHFRLCTPGLCLFPVWASLWHLAPTIPSIHFPCLLVCTCVTHVTFLYVTCKNLVPWHSAAPWLLHNNNSCSSFIITNPEY